MICRTKVFDAISYDYCPDDLPPPADRIQRLMHGRFIDELTGNPISAQLTVSSQLENVRTRASASAVAGLIANPARRFPGLATNTVELDMTVRCRGFIQQSFSADLGPFNTGVGDPADFPNYFATVDLGDIGLHRQATVIRGRCVHNDGVSRTPLSNAAVQLTGVWHQFPAADVDQLAVVAAPDIIFLLQGLYSARRIGIDQVRQRSLQAQIGEEKTLVLPAAAGATQVRLSDRVNLVAGQVLGIEVGHSERVEYLQVVSVDGASTDTQAATVTLAYPLLTDHREGVNAVRVNPQPAGNANDLVLHAITGDQTLFLDALTDIDNTTVEISGAGAAEYHRVHLYSVFSDGDGYFSLPPISRVAMMQLHASHAVPPTDVDTIFSPDYEQFINRIDLIFG